MVWAIRRWWRDTPREVRWWWQRRRRGWSDPDAWNAAWAWDRLIIALLARMEGRWAGHPVDMTSVQWDELCAFILVALRRVAASENEWILANGLTHDDREAIYADAATAHRLLAEHWYEFWD